MVKYGIVGLIGTIVHFAVLIALVEWGHIHPVVSSTIGFIIVLVLSYLLNRNWTFSNDHSNNKSFIKYTVVSITGLLLNIFIMFTVVEIVHGSYLIGQCMVMIIVPPSNYLLNYYWTFR